MGRLLLTWLASLLLVLAFCLPAARTQAPPAPPPAPSPTLTPAPAPSAEGGGGQSGSAFPWLVAVLFTVVILLVVCMPSRKN
jgi:hypothetical protein